MSSLMLVKTSILLLNLVISMISNVEIDNEKLLSMAKNGHIKSQLLLGMKYEKGIDVHLDYTEAAFWYRKSAESGDAEAQYRLGDLYAEGKGVPQDWDKSEAWIKKSAEQGLAKAQYRYAFTFYNYDRNSYLNWFGDFYKNREYKKAFAWFEKAANQDFPQALYFIGSMYENGEGVEFDIMKAEKYYRKAAKLGDSSAQWRIGIMHRDGEANAEWDYDKALYWFKNAALNGDDSAAVELGDIYFNGLEKPGLDKNDDKKGIDQNYTEAARWYLLAVKNGNKSRFGELGIMYLKGLGVPVKYDLAANILHKDAVKNSFSTKSKNYLAQLYKDGKGVNQNFYKCYIWISLAIKEVENSISNDSPSTKESISNFTKTKNYCGKQLSKIELSAAKELVENYWDKLWNTPGGFDIPIEL